MLHTSDKPSLQKMVSLPLEMRTGEMVQTYRPYKSLQGRLPLEMRIEAASLVSLGRPSLLECLSEMTPFQMSEAKIGEIQTLLFVGEALDPKETCLKLILSQR